jgi:signal transduction histidine kinase
MLISEMGGRIEVRSALGQGTTFTVVLNRADAGKDRRESN